MALELILEEEIREMVGARRFERVGQRIDHRNGTYLRRLMTSMGTVELAVPRARASGAAGAEVLGRYRRRTQDVDDAIVSAYVHGASTRDLGRITEALMGEQVGRSTVSRVTKSLNEKVEDLRKAAVTGPIPYLFLDATFLERFQQSQGHGTKGRDVEGDHVTPSPPRPPSR